MAFILIPTALSLLLPLLYAMMAISFGALIYRTVGPTATGVAVARASIKSDFKVPAEARELIGVMVGIQIEQPNAGDSILAVWDIRGKDFRYQPCEGLAPVGNGKLGAIDEMSTTPMEIWKIHAPMNGNETLDIGIEPLSAMAVDGQAFMTLIFSTVRTGKPVIYGKASREVATGTTADTITAGDDIGIDDGSMMHELWGVATIGTATVVVAEELLAEFIMRCTGWKGVQEQKFFAEPMHALDGATGGNPVMAIMRLPVDSKLKTNAVTITTEIVNKDALSAAGVYAHGVRWIGAPG